MDSLPCNYASLGSVMNRFGMLHSAVFSEPWALISRGYGDFSLAFIFFLLFTVKHSSIHSASHYFCSSTRKIDLCGS